MDQIFGRYKKQTKPNEIWGFQNGGFPQTEPSKIQNL